MCEKDESRLAFIHEHYPEVLTVTPEECKNFVLENSDHGGADVVLEVAGVPSTFQLAWQCARPNAIVTIVALYDEPQILPLPDMCRSIVFLNMFNFLYLSQYTLKALYLWDFPSLYNDFYLPLKSKSLFYSFHAMTNYFTHFCVYNNFIICSLSY